MSWTPEAWKSWGDQLKTNWNDTLQAAWTDIRNAVGPEIEADPKGAERDVAAFHDKLFGGPDAPGGPGIWYNIGYQWAKEKELGPERSAFLYEQVAVQLRAKGHDVTAADLTGDAAAKRAQEMSLGFLKDAKLEVPQSATPGFLPILVAGVLIIGFVGACWARVRMAQANVELDRTALSRESLARVDQASKEGRKLDGPTVAAIVGAAAAPNQEQGGGSGGGAGLGLMAVLGLGAVVAGGAFLLSRRS